MAVAYISLTLKNNVTNLENLQFTRIEQYAGIIVVFEQHMCTSTCKPL